VANASGAAAGAPPMKARILAWRLIGVAASKAAAG